jgi:hypothetical protein
MASLPFPFFVNQSPVDDNESNKRSALAAVGRCRVAPATCLGSNDGNGNGNDNDEYRAICSKAKEQALVDTSETAGTKDAVNPKQLKKKYMKQGVAMASAYLEETLKLDASVIDVEILVDGKDIIETDGCLAACLLDAGCARIVIDGWNVEGMDAAKIPRERLVAHFTFHFSEGDATVNSNAISAALVFADTVSVQVNNIEAVDRILAWIPEKKDHVVFQLQGQGDDENDNETLFSLVADISKKCKDGKGSIALVDPDATQLGLAYAACMKTDRDDGLYTTVVCTRSGEALGLVYSSKVRQCIYIYLHTHIHVLDTF